MSNALLSTSWTGESAVRACPTDDTCEDWANLVRAEYCEMPGLSLTEEQVERLWCLDPALAKPLLNYLVDAGFLRRTPTGIYVRADVGAC